MKAPKAAEQPWMSPMAIVRGLIVSPASSRAAEFLRELAGNIAQLPVEQGIDPTGDHLGHSAEKRLCDSSGHAGQRVAVPTQGDRLPLEWIFPWTT